MSTDIYDPYPPIQNKYYKWYMNICLSKQKERGWFPKYRQPQNLIRHHIDPKSFYIKYADDGWKITNPDIKENFVFLTIKEHFIIHKLLCKCYVSLAKKKMVYAFSLMGGKNENDFKGENNPMFGRIHPSKGIKRPNISIMMTGANNPMYGHIYTPETLEKMRKPKSETHKQNLRKPKSELHKNKLKGPRLHTRGSLNHKSRSIVLGTIEYATITEASEKTGLSRMVITNYLSRGKPPTRGKNLDIFTKLYLSP